MQKFIDISDGKRGVALMSKGIHEYRTDVIDGKSVVERLAEGRDADVSHSRGRVHRVR